MIKTKHCKVRQQQRAIPDRVIDWLLTYGEVSCEPSGRNIFYFSKTSLLEMRYELPTPYNVKYQRYAGVRIVTAKDEKIVTAFWEH